MEMQQQHSRDTLLFWADELWAGELVFPMSEWHLFRFACAISGEVGQWHSFCVKLCIFIPLRVNTVWSENGCHCFTWIPFFVFRRTIHSLHFAQIRIVIYCIPCNDFLFLGKGCFPHLLSMIPPDTLYESMHSVSLTCVWDNKEGQLFCSLDGMKDFYIGSSLLLLGLCRAAA